MADGPLRIAIDGRELLDRPTGVGRNLFEILRCWKSQLRHDVSIVVPSDPADSLRTSLGDKYHWVVEASPTAGTWWEQWHLPRALRRLRPNVLFAPAYTAPLFAPCPVVLTVHDVSYFAHPEWFSWREGTRRRWITRAAARRASTIITVSEFSRNEIARYVGVPAERIVVAKNGPPPEVTSPPASQSRLVLYVGSLFNRRRIPDMIDAFADAGRDLPDARFVLVGDNRTSPPIDPLALAAQAGVADRVQWLDYADEAPLNRLYSSARVLLFLSDYEGFAMTPLEAIAHGVPAVLLDTPVSREIYEGGARIVPPDRRAIAAAVRELLTDDRAHAALVAAGKSLLARYSWQRTADQVLAAIERAAR